MGATTRSEASNERKTRATYADLEKVSPERVAELIDGELITSPRPAMWHAKASSALGMLVGSAYQFGVGGPGGWHIIDEPELHFRRGEEFDVLVPDLAGWRKKRLPEVPDVAHMTLAPDWVGEVLSSSTESVDRLRKLPIYLREGVGHVWLVSVALRSIEVYRRSDPGWVLVGQHEGDDKVRAEPFDAFEFELANLWPAKVEQPAP